MPDLNNLFPGSLTLAYIGPGAGIALVGSFLAVLSAILSALLVIASWPIRRFVYAFRGNRSRRKACSRVRPAGWVMMMGAPSGYSTEAGTTD